MVSEGGEYSQGHRGGLRAACWGVRERWGVEGVGVVRAEDGGWRVGLGAEG